MRSRCVAAFTAMWLLVCGVLAARHEATVPHVRDSAGAIVHASALAGPHESRQSDIHGLRDPSADRGECTLLTASHQAASATVARPQVVAAVGAFELHQVAGVAHVRAAAAIYRVAPKTSPPRAV